jgi:hypothetical protein
VVSDSPDRLAEVADTSDSGAAEVAPAGATPHDRLASPFIGQWNRLVSTTNWEKGRIILAWRTALEEQGAAATEFSDETWAQLVGGVTSQHVGRLRRVSARFADVRADYEGLFWSHFQAALDWDDAEMWLEGAVQNHWSISQMRGKRWETRGHSGAPPEQEEMLDDDQPEDVAADDRAAAEVASPEESTAVKSVTGSDSSSDESSLDDEPCLEDADEPAPSAARRTPLSVEVDDLPDDLAEAFEQFKLAIITHRREGWQSIRPEDVLECLDALKELAMAPLD